MSKEDNLVPKLIRETINKLNETIEQKNDYIKILEGKLQELETENYFLRRNKKLEEHTKGGTDLEIEIIHEEEDTTHNVEEGLKNMGLDSPEALEELSDLLDEVFEKKDDDAKDEE
tara:strand:+ start:218 stop:565 length:348 start_codon:yes stop_codon:yes gene_type:complete